MKFNFFFFLLILCNPPLAFMQNAIEVDLDKVSVDEEGFIKLWIKALDDGKVATLKKADIQLLESFKGKVDTMEEVYSLVDKLVLDTTHVEHYTILFLLDMGNKIKNTDVENAKRMIREVVDNYSTIGNTRFYLTAFHNRRIKDKQELTINNVEDELEELKVADIGSDFNRTLIEDIRFLREKKGKKVLFVMGSGTNEIEGIAAYDNLLPYVQEDVDKQTNKENLPDDFIIFSIGLGESESIDYDALRGLVRGKDFYSENRLPENYELILQDNTIIRSTHLAMISPLNPVYRGEKRNYALLINGHTSSAYSLRLGSTSIPLSLLGSPDLLNWALWFLLGLAIIISILGICSILVPIIQKKNFYKKYVSKYIQEGPVRLNDPVYNEPIKNKELVVRKCQQVVPLSTWEDIGGQCPNFPDCMDPQYLGCNGAGAPMEDNFFSRKGMFLQLNWIWYGAIGGFLAWVLVAFFSLLEFQGLKVLIAKVLPIEKLASLIGNNSIDNDLYQLLLNGLNNNLLLGIAFGFGLILMLSYIVELSEPREFQWKKLILRTFLGAFISVFIFLGGFYLQYGGIIESPYFSGLVTWLLFGVAVGTILSIGSNILLSRGMLGGLLAAIIAYNVYFGISNLFDNFNGAKLISLILLGAILGLVLVSVISRLENFELEFVAPKGLQNIPISKWLKNDQAILMGKEPGSYVFIKWEDPAIIQRHAQLSLENGTVYIQPLAETLVNRKIIPLHQKSPLTNKDLIQLGRESTTLIRYREKRVAKV